jgi:hypothetical protein
MYASSSEVGLENKDDDGGDGGSKQCTPGEGRDLHTRKTSDFSVISVLADADLDCTSPRNKSQGDPR